MGKMKRRKRPIADTVSAKKFQEAQKQTTNPFALAKPATSKRNPFASAKPEQSILKKMNPFEVHVNKEKFQILGRACKHDKGLPGVSREKAIKKRKETLGVQYQVKHKTNQFRDNRIGRSLNSEELSEDVLNARFVADRMEQRLMKSSKASKFNLNDDEILTHRGQTLEEIEQFRDDRSDDGEDVDDELDAGFTEAAHFGGDENDAELKDRKAAIDEMIMEQKKKKMEIAKEKDEVYELTERLDTNYKNLMNLVNKMAKNDDDKIKPEKDDFDKVMREMIFEPRGAVTDKLLSEEELAKNERERLEKLEQERLKRMRPEDEESEQEKQTKHRSADDLDDGYFNYEEEVGEEALAYNADGDLHTKEGLNERYQENVEIDDEENDVAGNSDGEDAESNEESDVDSEGAEEEESDDDLSDLKSNESNDEDDQQQSEKRLAEKSKSFEKKSHVNQLIEEMPFTFDMPASYAEFQKLLSPYAPKDQAIIVERLIKCNNPKLDGVNRENIIKIFAFTLQYINELFDDETTTKENIRLHFQILDKISPYLYDLMHLNPERMSVTLLDVIKEKYSEYRKNQKKLPRLDTVIFFKLVSNLCSTSDFRHPVATPTYIFMQHCLSRTRVKTRQDLAIGLFIVTIILEFSQQSKRFVPSAFNYLLGILFLCVPKRPVEKLNILPPFKNKGPYSQLLVLDQAEKDELQKEENLKENPLNSEDFIETEINVDFKVRCFNTALKLIKNGLEIIGDNIGSNYIAELLLNMLERIPTDAYPSFVNVNCEETKKVLSTLVDRKLIKIVPPEKKPKALRLLEPRFEAVYDDKRRPKLTKEKEERVKLIHKLKRETKGAVREIRRDTQFIQKIRLQQQIKSDMERHEKVKRIFQDASAQQGELNELARLGKKKKF